MRHALVLTLALAALASPLHAAGDVRLAGRYQWNQGADGPLWARFTPQGEGSWLVSFSFRFDGRDLEYMGTARGSLEQGELSGEVTRGTGGRTFAFKGSVREGRFSGTHSERDGRGREQSTGTLTLGR